MSVGESGRESWRAVHFFEEEKQNETLPKNITAMQMMERNLQSRSDEGLAYNEAGHAVAAYVLGLELLAVNILPAGRHGGVTTIKPPIEFDTLAVLRNHGLFILCGILATQRAAPEISKFLCADDEEMLAALGYLWNPQEPHSWRADLEEEGNELLTRYWTGVIAVAQDLILFKELRIEALKERLQALIGEPAKKESKPPTAADEALRKRIAELFQRLEDEARTSRE